MKYFIIVIILILNYLPAHAQDENLQYKFGAFSSIGHYNFNNAIADLSNWSFYPYTNVGFSNVNPLTVDFGLTKNKIGLNLSFFQLGKFGMDIDNLDYFCNNLSLDFMYYPFNTNWYVSPYVGIGIGYSWFRQSVFESGWRVTDSGVGWIEKTHWDKTTSSNLFKSQYVPLRLGAIISPFKGWLKGDFIQGVGLKFEKSLYFFNNKGKNILDGSRTSISLGWFGFVDI